MVAGCQIIGFDWRYRYINDAAMRDEGRTKEEFLGHTLMERYPGIEKTPVFAILQRSMHERSVERSATEVTYPDGSSAWLELLVQWQEIHQRCLAGAVESSEADPFPRADGSLDWVRWEIHHPVGRSVAGRAGARLAQWFHAALAGSRGGAQSPARRSSGRFPAG